MSKTYKLFRPGDLVTDIREVGPGVNTEFLRLATGQVVNSYGGQEILKDRDGNLIYPSPHCAHCGKPSFARDSQGRKYLWEEGNPQGCHCPLHPVGDGSDGGPILPKTIEDRRVMAAEQQTAELRGIRELLEILIRSLGGNLPAQAPAARKAS